MERLSTQNIAQDANGCIALCYQLNQPINVQSVDTAVAVQSLLDSQAASENQEEDEDIFQCGKCKKQFTSLTEFVKHKQISGCLQQQQQIQQQQIHLSQQHHQQQQQQLSLGGNSSNAYSSTMNITTNAPILQAHPCLTRSLNQPTNAATLTLSGVSPSSLSHLSQSMVFTDDLMSLANIDPNSLNGQTIQMVTGPVQTGSTSNGVTIYSPITSLATTPNNNYSSPVGVASGQLLVRPAQHITLTTITDKGMQQQQLQQQSQIQHLSQTLSPQPLSSMQQSSSVTLSHCVQPIQSAQTFKQGPTKAGRKSAQKSFISVLNPDNSVNLLSTRKGKSARNSKNNTEVSEEESNAKPKLQCTYCNKQFTKNFDLQQHIRAHTGEKPFQCIVCGRAFAQKSNVKKHMATHKVWPCGISNTLPKQPEPTMDEKDMSSSSSCSSLSSSSSVLTTMAPTQAQQLCELSAAGTILGSDPKLCELSAAGTILGSDPKLCELSAAGTILGSDPKLCELSAAGTILGSDPKLLSSAVQEGDDKDDTSPKVKVVVDNSYICQYCPSKFKTYYQLKTHLVNHKCEQVYKCVMKSCGQSFHDLDTFLEHVKSHENEMTYRCHQCHKYFKTLYDLGVHQYSHIYMNQGVKSGLRHFQCTKCGNKYTTPEALEHHISTTSHDYKCPHCSKQFTCERFLRRHLPIHGSEGQFECQQCKKRFKTEHYLKSHILIHTGETPFSCEICQAAFNRKDKLKRHMTIHDLVKKYRCPFRSLAGCLKEFNRPDKLKAHIVTHSGIKPFKCSICDKGFSRKPHLLEHERGHKMDYRFKCDKCGKGYFRPKLFNEHKCQPSKSGSDQQFRPRNRRKVGRPRKRMISIAPDSLSKSRGKQYASRTRMKGKLQRLQTAEEVSDRQQDKAFSKHDGNDGNTKKYEGNNTLSVEFVKALPLVSSSSKGQNVVSIDGAGTIHIPGLDNKNTITASLGHVQQFSLGRNGELVDHYVVHLTESVDGSGPTIQTAFVPAVSGGQIFTSGPGGMGIQPIAIIEARSFNIGQGDGSGAQVLTAEGANAILACAQGHLDGTNVSGGGYITVSDGAHVVSDGEQVVKSELEEAGMIMMSEDGTRVRMPGDMIEGHVVMGRQGATQHEQRGSQIMEMDSVMSGEVCADSNDGGVESGGQLMDMGSKDQSMMVVNNHGLMVSAGEMVSVEAGGDMMESALSLFGQQPGGQRYVGGQVVVSGDQTYITCNVDYTTADHVLDGNG